jgi:hypothetical protein
MKKMLKILALVLIMGLVLGFVGCGDGTSGDDKNNDNRSVL